MPSAEELADALGLLRVQPPADWEDVRSAYRNLLMEVHPDATGTPDEGRTTEIVDAFRLLRTATDDGTTPLASVLATAAAEAAVAAAAVPGPVVLHSSSGDVFGRVCDALSSIGDISGLDRSSGMVQAMVTEPGHAASQLTAEITPVGGGEAQVLFTLEPMGRGEPPLLSDLVSRLNGFTPT